MPRSVLYKASSIIFFEGDRNENVYILQSGSVLLRYADIETGAQEQDVIKTGEFFGVKSALGHYPKDETAMALNDSQVLVMTVSEFELMMSKNSRLILKMLKVFSNQLRRVHKQVSDIISNGKVPVDSEKGLFDVGEYYYKNNQFKKAAYIFKQYITYYPTGESVQLAQQYKNEAEACVLGKKPSLQVPDRNLEQPDYAQTDEAPVDEITKEYYSGVSLFSQSQYEKALRVFKKVNTDKPESEFGIKSLFDIGKCFFALNYWDNCIKQMIGMIKTYPKHPNLTEALLYIGQSYQHKAVNDKAAGFYKKVLAMEDSESKIYRKAKKALDSLGGAA